MGLNRTRWVAPWAGHLLVVCELEAPPFKRAIVMHDPEILDPLFREAVSAIDAGDVSALERLLAAHPSLV